MAKLNDQLVLHVTDAAATLVRVRRRGERLLLQQPVVVVPPAPLPDEPALAAETVVDDLAKYVRENGWRGLPTTVALAGAPVSCQSFDIPDLKGPALASAIRLKIGQSLHYDVKRATVWTRHDAKPDGTGYSVSAVAVQQTHAQRVVEACERIGVELRLITAAPAALSQLGPAIGAIEGQGLEGLLVGMERGSAIHVYFDGRLIVSSDLPFKLADLTTAAMRPIIKGERSSRSTSARARQLRDEVGIPEFGAHIDPLDISAERVLPLFEPAFWPSSSCEWFTFARRCNNATPRRMAISGPAAQFATSTRRLAHGCTCRVAMHPWASDRAELEGADTAGRRVRRDRGGGSGGSALPDLTPIEVRRATQLKRVRRVSLLAGPTIAAALVMLAVGLQSLSVKLSTAAASQTNNLQRSHNELSQWTAWQLIAARARSLRGQLDAFAIGTPRWEGIFKELSNALPTAVCVNDLSLRMVDGVLRLRVTANSQDPQGKQPFDQIVEQALRLLQASPYMDHVDLLSATKSANSPDDPSRGELILDVTLAYPRPSVGGKGAK
ncbi:MAG: hypothetical protein U1A27_05950 [Phycisphaerae bacterium]